MLRTPRFSNRFEAGRELARALTEVKGETTVVVGLARGGVQVASEVARALGAPLDALAVRKVGHPLQPEYAVGAVAPGGIAYVRSHDGLTDAELTDAKTAVLVDDGLATGATMVAAARWARASGARRVVAAVPAGAAQTVALLRTQVDDVVCLRASESFGAVGFWYVDFDQVDDLEVIELLEDAARRRPVDAPA
jgi:putative phosphoribosyl transferase